MRRTLLRLLGLALVVAALVTYVKWNSDRDANRFNPASHLHCAAGTRIAGALATTAPTDRETRTPEQLATAWAATRSPGLAPGQRRLFSADDRVDIGLDLKTQTVAVLTFRADDHLGWHLAEVVACQTVTASPS